MPQWVSCLAISHCRIGPYPPARMACLYRIAVATVTVSALVHLRFSDPACEACFVRRPDTIRIRHNLRLSHQVSHINGDRAVWRPRSFVPRSSLSCPRSST